jgi:hypothetical protein
MILFQDINFITIFLAAGFLFIHIQLTAELISVGILLQLYIQLG